MRLPRSISTGAGLALVLGMFAVTPAIGASAAPPPQLWVNINATAGTDTSCLNPGFTTISAALTAAPTGAVINVCHGQYSEQLVITRAVTLRASEGSVTVFGPSTPSDTATACDADGPGNEDVVDICMTGKVVITGFTIVGGWPSDVCDDDLYGVAVLGGATLNMSQSTVRNIGGDPLTDGCQGGVGIQVGLSTSATTADPGHATLTNVAVSEYQKNGITVDGKGSTATMNTVTVTGAGPSNAIAQNGIQVSDSATTTINRATVGGNECDDTAGGCSGDPINGVQSAGILLFDAGKTTVKNSTVIGNDMGIYNLEDYAWAYYTPPSPFHPIVETFSNMTLANRYEGAVIDSGVTAVNGSRISGGGIGIAVIQYDGQPTGATLTATRDTITATTGAALDIDTDTTSGYPVAASITDSSMDLSNADGIDNAEAAPGDDIRSVVNAVDDWWGSNTGPSFWGFGSGSAVDSAVNFFPWALTSALHTFKTCTSGTNVSTSGNDVVLCAAGAGNDTLTNAGSGAVLLIGNNGNDHLNASATGRTWIIPGSGNNVINERSTAVGQLQTRGNQPNDTVVNLSPFFLEVDN